MFLRSLTVILILLGATHGKMSVMDLAKCIMSEASIGTLAEQTAIGFACQRNSVHASDQYPTNAITKLATEILNGKITDPTRGAANWYSPRSMPKSTEKSRCKRPVGSGQMDCSGGLEQMCGTTQNYKPSWANESKRVVISGVRECYYKFYKL